MGLVAELAVEALPSSSNPQFLLRELSLDEPEAHEAEKVGKRSQAVEGVRACRQHVPSIPA